VVDAKKERIGEKPALALARSMQKVVVAKGAKVVTFDLRKDPPSDAELAAVIMGPTGNLRAPALKVGSTLLVGFNEEAYDSLLR
jgi:arsenate reductase-like glutaredoxin family protein